MNGTFELSLNSKVLIRYGDGGIPSLDNPDYRITLFTPEFALGKRLNEFREEFTVYSLAFPTEFQFFNFETGFIAFNFRILGLGIGLSRQTGF